MLLCEIKTELSPDQMNELRRNLVKNIKEFCKSTFDKPVDITGKTDHISARHHTNEQIEFDIWLHDTYVFFDNFYLDSSLKNQGLGTQFVETLVASLPEHLTIKVRDHSHSAGDKTSLSHTFWDKMKARHTDRKWILVR